MNLEEAAQAIAMLEAMGLRDIGGIATARAHPLGQRPRSGQRAEVEARAEVLVKVSSPASTVEVD